ncbi:MAG: hydantoinase/oxoprolinase family protein [Chloroflexi bacterium]|nr:hydantoinase/oxoprolinase family protein [Chloroflexota bacterium]
MDYHLGFDIGGTFTDLALLDSTTGQIAVHKVLTTPEDPARGALDGIQDFLARQRLSHEDLGNVIHATTLVANTLIEHNGALVGLITTRGFRDILEIRTEQRYDIYDLFLRYPPPLSPRHLRRGVRERIDRDGRVLEAVDPAEIRQVVADFKAQGVEAIAVCFLHAFRNPIHERQVEAIVRAEWPEVPLSLSSAVAPEIREYERTSTTAANAYVQPLIARYLRALRDDLQAAGFRGQFYPMLSSGNITPVSAAIEQPIRLAESGPAAGAIAAVHYGGLAGWQNLLSFDMGGTTAKLCLIHEGQPTIAPALEVGRVHRFKKGSGYPLQFPTVEMLEIGAGGGSIAWIDSLGLLKIGPQSAGASPGPACYGFGGQHPTVTDADLVLGYLNAEYFLGGQMRLDVEAARAALRRIAEPLEMDVLQAAYGIHRLVNENMASAARIHVIEQARDPRKYALVSFGGAGPVHAAGVARILGSPEVIAPPSAGVTSAIGLLIAPTAFDFARSYPTALAGANWPAIGELFAEMEERGLDLLDEAGVAREEAVVRRSADGRFEGQLHEIEIPLPDDLGQIDVAEFTRRFNAQYELLYHHLPSQMPIELLTWRVTVSGQRAPVRLARLTPSEEPADVALKGHRPVYFAEAGGFSSTPVYDRYRLAPGMRLPGPAVVEERESTTIIPPGMSAHLDDYLNLHIDARVEL